MKLPKHALCVLALSALPLAAGAQQAAAPAPAAVSPASPMPPPDQLEPGVNTSANSAPAPSAPAAGGANNSSTGASTPPAAPKSSAATSAATPGKSATPASPAKGKAGPDRLQLDATDITGNRELPKVLYIVPWKHADLGDLSGRPPNSLLDEVLQPLDRDVFKRENRYYDDLKPEAAAPKGGAASGSGNNP
jgi:hypothetical protein